jgi:hypothetical protein
MGITDQHLQITMVDNKNGVFHSTHATLAQLTQFS